MELESVPGIGERTAEQLATLDDPERALRTGDVLTIASAPAISEGRAARLARNAIRQQHNDTEPCLRTERAESLYDSALELLQEGAVTDHATRRLETFYPSCSHTRIEEVRTYVTRAIERNLDPAVRSALESVAPLSQPVDVTVRDRCLATASPETHARASDAVPELSIERVEDTRELSDLARGYSTVIALDESFAGLDLPDGVRVEPAALEQIHTIVPERLLVLFGSNQERIRAAMAVHERAGLDRPCSFEKLRATLDRLDAEGSIVGDDRLTELTVALDDLEVVVARAETVANERLRGVMEDRDVTIEGADLLSLAEQGARVERLLERELNDAFEEAIELARSILREHVPLETLTDQIDRVFPDDPTFPVTRNERALSQLTTELRAAKVQHAAEQKAELAATLQSFVEPVERMIERALDLDVELAIARFHHRYDCTMPEIVYDGDGDGGVSIEAGRSPLLDLPYESVEPVSYSVRGTAILSGVNSGGKTSLLDLVGLVVILAQMGLPVPARSARIELFDAIYYQEKSQGTLDAGAFEATLRSFGELLDDAGTQLVLVDELESITEPGASATIIAGILDALNERAATGVFVSHLAAEIRTASEGSVQIDGIQARGLVDGELEVDRTPIKDTIARSTPELIVEKLATDERAPSKSFYTSLLSAFDDNATPE